MQRKKVGIVIFDDAEVLDFCGPPVARATAQYMEYQYPETNARRVPTTST